MENQAIKDYVVEVNNISHRLAYVTIKFCVVFILKVIQAYTPTLSHQDETVDEFYENLRTLKLQ